MAITSIQNPATATGATGNPAITLTSTAVLADDYIIWWGTKYTNGTITAPSGFTDICAVLDSAAGSDNSCLAAYKKAVGGEEDDVLTGGYSAGSDQGWVCGAIVVRGVDTGTPFDVVVTHGTYHVGNVNDPTPTCVGVTTVTDGAWVFQISEISDSTSGSSSIASGNGSATEFCNGISSDRSASIGTYQEIATAQAVAGDTHTYTGAGAGSEWATLTFALRPAAGGGTSVGALINNSLIG